MVEPYKQKVNQMKDLTVFNYNTNAIRTQVTDEGEPLFCLADICKVLDGNQPNKVAEAIREEFGCPELNSAHVMDSLGREQEATFITEPQLYFVLMRSRSENARPFRQWVVNDVLPSIRKTGKYEAKPTVSTNEALSMARQIYEAAGLVGNQLALAMDKMYQAKIGESALALGGVELVRPQPKQLATPTEIGKPLGLSAIRVNKMLEARGLQTKVSGQWTPTSKGLEAGATVLDTGKKHSSGVPVTQLKWPSDILG